MQPTRLALIWSPVLTLFAGCGDPPRSDETTSETNTDGITSQSTTGPTGPGTTEEPPGDTGSDTSTTGSVDACETTDCDGVCCGEGEECVLGACLPGCASEVRCGGDLSTCCDAGDVCLQPECVTPGDSCLDSYDCPEGWFCELQLDPELPTGRCLPQPKDLCEVLPEFEEVELALEWSWDEQQIVSTPVVADIDGDDLPEVIVNTTYYDENGDGDEDGPGEGPRTGIIVVFDGTTGKEQFRIVNEPQNCDPDDACTTYGSYGRATVGVADVDGNGLPDIIYAGRPETDPLNRSKIHAFNGVGQHLWTSHTVGGAEAHIYARSGAPAFGNFDDDDESEIVYGAAILDNDGLLVWDQDGDGGLYGSPAGYRGPISAIADLTDDGYPEIISGQHAWSVSWVDTPTFPNVTLTNLWDAGAPDGYPAIADMDQDGDPEVILVAGGMVRVLEGDTGLLWCGVDPTGATCALNAGARTQALAFPDFGVTEDRGGPATVADFDGDGRPEFAAAGAGAYVVFDLNRDDEDIVQPGGFLPPAPGDLFVRWYALTQDETSRSTGSSVFDFQGDGISEVLYGDECFTRVYSGATGDVITEIENSSVTHHEYPIVVDADADGNSEILVVATDQNAETLCASNPDYTPRRGLYVYGDPNDQWVRTRMVWNSHTYHVTNSDSRGLTPANEVDNWTVEGLNNYRQNFQGLGVFNAADLTVDLQVDFEDCLDEEFEIVAIVRNAGSLGVPAGISVALYEGTDTTGMLVGMQETEVPLLPGAFTMVSWTVPAPGGQEQDFFVIVDDEPSLITECIEDNNTATTTAVSCPVAG